MKAIFRNGKNLSANTEQALKYVAMVGVMSKEIWAKSFCQGSKRWKNKQLKILLDNGLLKLHGCGLGDFYVLGDQGREVAKTLGWRLVDSVSSNQVLHDELVGHSLWKLEQKNICKNWMIEKELKEQRHRQFLVKDQGDQSKYPDAVFDAFMGGSFHQVALEYEKNGKTIPRYRAILWSYNKMNRFSMVLFIVESDVIRKRIKYSLRHLGRVSLIEQIGFVDAKAWQSNPMSAVIELASTKTSFEKLSLVK